MPDPQAAPDSHLGDDDVLELVRGRPLGELAGVEAHLADCAACSALVAAMVTSDAEERAAGGWGALVGTSLGPYRLEAQIGAGAAGAVYRGWDERLRRRVAVKVLRTEGAPARWIDTEARAAAAIAHVNVVTIHDVGRDGGHAYVVSELVEGESLRSVLAAGALPPARVRRLGIELARGLTAAHAAGVIHRDLKPENLLITRDGTLKILDFGLAKLADAAGGLDATQPGTLLGTVGYMAPEQARGEPIDARADLFAAGALLHEAAAGRRAFDGASHAERLSAVLRDTPPTTGPLAPIISRCLAKDPTARFQSAADLLWSLEQLSDQVTEDEDPSRSPRASGAAASRGAALTRRSILLGAGAMGAMGALGFAAGRLTARRAPRAPTAPPTPQQLTFRQGRLMTARFAHHGGDIYYGAAWDTGPLAAHTLRLDGGVTRALPFPAADVLAVSRTQLALGLDRKNVDGQSATGRLALAPIDGGLPRELAADVQDTDFTPDGRELAIVTRAGHGFRLELPAGNILLEGAAWITHPRVSPDGRHVACLVHPDSNDDQGAVVVVDRATRATRTLSDRWASIAGLAWDPRGDRLWFTGSRTNADNALRSLTLDGTTRDAFSTIGRLRLHDVTAGGRFLISRDVWRLRTMVTADAATSAPDVDRSLTPFSMVSDITADGATLIVAEFGDVEDVNGVHVVPTDGGARLRLGAGWPKALSPDGTQVLAIAFEPISRGRPAPILYDVRGRGRTRLDASPLTRIISAAYLDATHLILEGSAPDRPPRLWLLDTTTAGATPLTTEGLHGRITTDPTTNRAAFIDATGTLQLLTFPTTTRPIATNLRDHIALGFLGPDLLVRTTTSPIALSRISPTGTLSPHLTLSPPPLGLKGVDAVALARTTSRLAYSYGQELSELFLLDLPAG